MIVTGLEWIDEQSRARERKLKQTITPEWVLNRIEQRYNGWHYGPEPEITATELTSHLYEDCSDERFFASDITPHTDRILRKLRDDGKLEASETIKNGRTCLVYNRPDCRNPNNVKWPNNR